MELFKKVRKKLLTELFKKARRKLLMVILQRIVIGLKERVGVLAVELLTELLRVHIQIFLKMEF